MHLQARPYPHGHPSFSLNRKQFFLATFFLGENAKGPPISEAQERGASRGHQGGTTSIFGGHRGGTRGAPPPF